MKISIIGGGNMGFTYAKSFVNSDIVDKEHLLIYEKNKDRQAELAHEGYSYSEQLNPGIAASDLIILAVKPQQCQPVLEYLQQLNLADKMVLSIMAGITINFIKKYLHDSHIIRAMPNLPAQIGFGMTVYTTDNTLEKQQLFTIQNLLNTTGKSLYVNSEQLVDAATAISGSGPAYVFFFMQCMMEKAAELGFSNYEAELLTKQTFLGTINLFIQSQYDCNTWISKVASKGGTTEAAFNYFENKHLKENIKEGINNAFERAEALSKS